MFYPCMVMLYSAPKSCANNVGHFLKQFSGDDCHVRIAGVMGFCVSLGQVQPVPAYEPHIPGLLLRNLN